MANPQQIDAFIRKLNEMYNDIKFIRQKMSLPNNIAQIRNARFYLPDYPTDCIQTHIVDTNNYWDIQALDIIDKYLEKNAVILDIGANIGNHSLYWTLEKGAKKVYAFEPLTGTYEILLKNIELNNLQDKIIPYNFGLFDEETKAKVGVFNKSNIGGTSFVKSEDGNFRLVTLDSLDIQDKIDLIKIDVEGAEVEVLFGGIETIKKNKPPIVIETFTRKSQIDIIFKELGYKHTETIRKDADYIYTYTG